MPKKNLRELINLENSSDEYDEDSRSSGESESESSEEDSNPKPFLSDVRKVQLHRDIEDDLSSNIVMTEEEENDGINNAEECSQAFSKAKEQFISNRSFRRLLVHKEPNTTTATTTNIGLKDTTATTTTTTAKRIVEPGHSVELITTSTSTSSSIHTSVIPLTPATAANVSCVEGSPFSTSATSMATDSFHSSYQESKTHELKKTSSDSKSVSSLNNVSDRAPMTESSTGVPLNAFLSGYNLMSFSVEDPGMGDGGTSFMSPAQSRKVFERIILGRKKKPSKKPGENILDSFQLSNIFVNRPDLNMTRFPPNIFVTSKYTAWNFLFLSILEQFARVANFIFLLITIVQLIPGVSPFNIWATLIPLIFILSVTTIKEGVDDFLRHKKDKAVNSVEYLKIDSNGDLVSTPASALVPGDLIIVDDNEFFPADLLLMMASEADGTCYIDTSNLDGETNLKELSALGRTSHVPTPSMLSSLRGTLTCQMPNKDLGTFHGVISLYEHMESNVEQRKSDGFQPHRDAVDSKTAVESVVDINNLLLKGSVLRNSGWVVGMVVFTGNLTKLAMNTNQTRFKFSKIETELNRVVPSVFGLQIVVTLICAICARFYDSRAESMGIILSSPWVLRFLFDVFTFFILFSFFVPMSMYVVFEFSRSVQAFFMERDLDMYDENGGVKATTTTLNEELGNVQFILSDKTGTLTKNTMTAHSFSMGGYEYVYKDLDTHFQSNNNNSSNHRKSGKQEAVNREPKDLADTPRTANTQQQNSNVASTPVTTEDSNATRNKSGEKARGSNDANNKLSSPKNANRYDRQDDSRSDVHCAPTVIPKHDILERVLKTRNNQKPLEGFQREQMTMFMRTLCLCNTVKPVDVDGTILLRSESADEDALMAGGLRLGWQIVFRNKEHIVIREGFPFNCDIPSGNLSIEGTDIFSAQEYHTFSILHVLPFTSARQRMSMVVKDLKDGCLYLFTKGADSRILSMCEDRELFTDHQPSVSSGDKPKAAVLRDIYLHTQKCSSAGYRILLLAYKKIKKGKFGAWEKSLEKANRNMKKRKEAVEEVFRELEFGITIVGATAVDDELQDDVRKDIQTLRDAGITVAMATGDKKETALIIGRNCGLLEDNQTVFDLTGSKTEILLQVATALEFTGCSPSQMFQQRDLVMRKSSRRRKGLTRTIFDQTRESMSHVVPGYLKQVSERRLHKKSPRDLKKKPSGAVCVDIEECDEIDEVDPTPGVSTVDRSTPILPKSSTEMEVYGTSSSQSTETDIHHAVSHEADDPSTHSPSSPSHQGPSQLLAGRDLVSLSSVYNSRSPILGFQSTHEESKSFVLIVDGKSVDYLLKKCGENFSYLLSRSRTAICCRMSPKQKARVIFVMKRGGLVCCAVGDGANDVSMIRESSVGVGIKGKEGNAAVYSADYVIPRFHHLLKLIMVHGRNNYRGNCYSIFTAFYSHLTFSIPLFIYGMYSMFSGQTVYSSFLLSTLFLFMSPIYASVGWFYQDLPSQYLLDNPSIYKHSLNEALFTTGYMWSYIIKSILHALLCTYTPILLVKSYQSLPMGTPLEMWSMGYSIWINVILGIILSGMIMVPRWNLSFIVMFGLSVSFIFLVTFAIYWLIKDELHDSLPIIFRSPSFYIQTIFVLLTYYFVNVLYNSLCCAFIPEPWRIYAEKIKMDSKATNKNDPPLPQ